MKSKTCVTKTLEIVLNLQGNSAQLYFNTSSGYHIRAILRCTHHKHVIRSCKAKNDTGRETRSITIQDVKIAVERPRKNDYARNVQTSMKQHTRSKSISECQETSGRENGDIETHVSRIRTNQDDQFDRHFEPKRIPFSCK
jgi:hypothetical protein